MNRCNICVDPQCDGRKDCNCDTCDKKDSCYRVLTPTIRITTKCTQACSHCCFSCSPQREDFMSIEKAKEINQFLISNNIDYINVMGGEFFMHPDWFKVITTLGQGIGAVRIVTNGDWIQAETKKVKKLTEHIPVYFAISKDRWHNNRNVEAAAKFCSDNMIPYKVATEDETTTESIVPIGRSEFDFGMYSMFMCYCTKPDRKYSFLIDEQGIVSKCPMGAWEYADVSEYVDGGFDKRFKEFTTIFYSEFIPNCATCIRIYNSKS